MLTVLIEFGLIGLDSIPRLQRDLHRWLLQCSSFPGLSYTLPEIILQNNHGAIESVGHFLNVSGPLTSGGSGPYRVCLNKKSFFPMNKSV